jgi:hypothetical protein
VHLIVDSYATHKHAKVRTWLAQRARYHIHYTPTYSSWLNQVERWFALLTQRAIRRGSFRSVRELVNKIDGFVQQYNRSHRLFVCLRWSWFSGHEKDFSALSRNLTGGPFGRGFLGISSIKTPSGG